MRSIAFTLILLVVTALCIEAQVAPNPSKDPVFFCPMDKDVRSNTPGTCPRCGMKLVAGVPDPLEFHLDLVVTPHAPTPQEKIHMSFEVHDPWKDNPVKKFNVIHEKLFHAFIVSEDLQFFVHDHPVWTDNSFQYDIALPKPGMYRILGDFFPEGATPQLITKTIYVGGLGGPGGLGSAPPSLTRDYSPKTAQNLEVALSTAPARPVAGVNTQMRFTVTPADGLEKYLGAWAHMLAASDDLIDMIHTHPILADGSSQIQFDLTFPRARTYRVWVQFQRNGVVNTVHFDVPVEKPAVNPE